MWERFQELLRRCPSSLLHQGNPIYSFFNGLMKETQAMLNANAGGQLMEKSSTDVHELCKRVAKQSRYYASKERRMPRKQGGLLDTDEATSLQAQITTLTKKLSNFETNMGVKAVMACGVCQGDHHTDLCPALMELVNYVGNYGRQGFQN